jgi:hypothetical protein
MQLPNYIGYIDGNSGGRSFMRFHGLYSIFIVLIVLLLCNCYTVAKYLNNFTMLGLNAGSLMPKTVDSIAVPKARISANIQYSNVSKVRYNNGQHSPVDSNVNSASYSYSDFKGTDSLQYKEYNITWKTPPFFSSFSADFGPFARIISVSTQTDIAVIANNCFYNLKVGPSVQFIKNRSGIRLDFIFSIGNYLYTFKTIMSDKSIQYNEQFPFYDSAPVFGFCPYLTVNTLREFLYLRYFVQAGYQLNTPFFTKDGLSVKLSHTLLSAGLFKDFSFYTMMTGVRFAYETRCDIFTNSKHRITRTNSTDTPVIPAIFYNLTFNLKFR